MSAQEAYDALLSALRRGFEHAERGEDATHLVPEAARALRQLDLHMTGNDDCRSQDESRLLRLFGELSTYHVHLSDGGWSRISLDVVYSNGSYMGPAIAFDRTLSRPRAAQVWDSLTHPTY